MLKSRHGFTLVELLVAIAIIGILAALMLGGVQYSRNSARQIECQNNLRQIGIANHGFHDNKKRFPPGWSAPQGWGWGAHILPFMDHNGLAGSMDVKYDPHTFVSTTPPDAGEPGDVSLSFYLCPADGSIKENPNYTSGGSRGYKKSNYVASHGDTKFIEQMPRGMEGNEGHRWFSSNFGHTGIFGLSSSTTMPEISDGLSNTFLVGERQMSQRRKSGRAKLPGAIWIRCTNVAGTFMLGSSVVGTCGGAKSDHGREVPRLNSDQANFWGFSSMHRGGANFVMADASVHFFYDEIEYQVYRHLGNMLDGQNVEDVVARGY